MKTRKEITNLTITAVFIALLFIQTFVPNVGYVRILPNKDVGHRVTSIKIRKY